MTSPGAGASSLGTTGSQKGRALMGEAVSGPGSSAEGLGALESGGAGTGDLHFDAEASGPAIPLDGPGPWTQLFWLLPREAFLD